MTFVHQRDCLACYSGATHDTMSDRTSTRTAVSALAAGDDTHRNEWHKYLTHDLAAANILEPWLRVMSVRSHALTVAETHTRNVNYFYLTQN